MCAQDTNKKTISLKKARKKKGFIYLLIAVVFIITSLVLYSVDIVGVVTALINVAMIVVLLIGLGYLILGFAGKE